MGKQLYKEKKTYAQTLGEKEVEEYGQHLFDLHQYGGEQEAERLIQHYSEKNIRLREADKKLLRDNAPKAPDFPPLSQAQYNKKSCFGKRSYRKKVRSYFEYRKQFYTEQKKEGETQGMKLTRLREEIESGEYYQKSPEAEEMDRIFQEQQNDQKSCALFHAPPVRSPGKSPSLSVLLIQKLLIAENYTILTPMRLPLSS